MYHTITTMTVPSHKLVIEIIDQQYSVYSNTVTVMV